jgi:hypothetical protein
MMIGHVRRQYTRLPALRQANAAHIALTKPGIRKYCRCAHFFPAPMVVEAPFHRGADAFS